MKTLWTACSCLALVLAPAVVWAQSEGAPAPDADDPGSTSLGAYDQAGEHAYILERLASDDYQVREQTTQDLLIDPTITPETIRDLLALADQPEQRHRLLRVARHKTLCIFRRQQFREIGPGSLGVSLSSRTLEAGELPGLTQPAVEVVLTLPGFPAYEQLRPGDRIIEFAGRPVPEDPASDQFSSLIKLHQAGETVQMTVIRDGQRVPVSLVLASYEALDGMYTSDPPDVNHQFELQWRAVRGQLLRGDAELTPLDVLAY